MLCYLDKVMCEQLPLVLLKSLFFYSSEPQLFIIIIIVKLSITRDLYQWLGGWARKLSCRIITIVALAILPLWEMTSYFVNIWILIESSEIILLIFCNHLTFPFSFSQVKMKVMKWNLGLGHLQLILPAVHLLDAKVSLCYYI